ncbi:MAG: MFS transporter [Thermomicrobiales bacterium]
MQLLRHHDDFRRLWLAQTISQIGGQVTYLALPLTAAISLQATPAQMGLLTAMGAMPSLIVGLIAGEVVDRRARRPILISADLVRAVLLATIPLAWIAGVLSMPLLYVVAFLAGACALFFDIAYQAFVPSLLDRQKLVEGNSLLELSRSAAEVIGPTLGGGLVQVLKAPLAIAVDACSFLASAVLIARIRIQEPRRHLPATAGSIWRTALTGMREVGRSAPLRALAVSLAAIGLFNAMIEAVVILYLTRSVGLAPGLLGLVFAIGSAGFVVGALLPARLVRAIGVGPTLAASIAVIGLSDLALPLVGQDVRLVALAVALGQFFFGLGLTVFRVAQISVRQAIVPDLLLGRVGGALNVLGWGIAPLGAVVGGLLGQMVGLRWTLVVGALLEAATAIWIWRSPLWAMRDIALREDAE